MMRMGPRKGVMSLMHLVRESSLSRGPVSSSSAEGLGSATHYAISSGVKKTLGAKGGS